MNTEGEQILAYLMQHQQITFDEFYEELNSKNYKDSGI